MKKTAVEWFAKQLDENKDKTNLNIRTLIIVSKIRKQFPDTWKNLAEYMINS